MVLLVDSLSFFPLLLHIALSHHVKALHGHVQTLPFFLHPLTVLQKASQMFSEFRSLSFPKYIGFQGHKEIEKAKQFGAKSKAGFILMNVSVDVGELA